jgi:hypothetical protein
MRTKQPRLVTLATVTPDAIGQLVGESRRRAARLMWGSGYRLPTRIGRAPPRTERRHRLDDTRASGDRGEVVASEMHGHEVW